jgi:hypothetical protein
MDNFQPINDSLSYIPFHNRPTFVEHLSGKQKALFYIWELERAVVGTLLPAIPNASTVYITLQVHPSICICNLTVCILNILY